MTSTKTIRTAGNPLHTRPSLALAATVLTIVAVGMALPFAPFAGLLGLVPMPASYYVFVVGVTTVYLLLVEVVKRWLMRRLSVKAAPLLAP